MRWERNPSNPDLLEDASKRFRVIRSRVNGKRVYLGLVLAVTFRQMDENPVRGKAATEPVYCSTGKFVTVARSTGDARLVKQALERCAEKAMNDLADRQLDFA